MDLRRFERFLTQIRFTEGCWDWLGGQDNGYGRFDGKRAHRLMWEAANGPIPPGLFVLHHCDNPPCVRPTHLYVGTKKDNARDAAVREHHATKLTAAQIPLIRADRERGMTQVAIADKYLISQTHVSAILARKTWSHVA